ncbi:polysaccharide deacetylase family protein [Pseudoalteromonas sp. MMG005]|uniref:polysaccharide deacetylase family protein n=1 Tax=Pseudoalteromonas sp. MMG005 TaxID=2822682 RepID=UPI001B3A5DC4|nr:polysaccharide deacetylase family protein [Pseudoalteromonas sp. MMG005]MBQ4845415.1 polysaccharide deacetylase family protein [Pseudoalteromonas sp. MMG005]
MQALHFALSLGLLTASVLTSNTVPASELGSTNTDWQNYNSKKYLGFKYPSGAQNAVSITFDDARDSQITVGMDIFAKHQVKGTFYVVPESVSRQLIGWKKAVEYGHEIANHTSNHTCTGNFEWLRARGMSLENATLDWLKNDIGQANSYLKTHLGITPTSFAYPCGNTFVGRGVDTRSYVPLIAQQFQFGRTWNDETANNPNFTDFAKLTAIRIDGQSFKQIKTTLESVKHNNSWIILAGHEVGEKGLYTVDKTVLDQLITYLKDPKNGYWLETVNTIGSYIKQHRKAP